MSVNKESCAFSWMRMTGIERVEMVPQRWNEGKEQD